MTGLLFLRLLPLVGLIGLLGAMPAARAAVLPTLFAYQGVDAAACAQPANPVVAENCQPGTNEWAAQNYINDIEVFASVDSIAAGQSIDFFVDTNAQQYDLYVYRSGYYGGLGGRLVHTKTGLRGDQQPGCARAEDTGLRTCSNWRASYTLHIPDDWVSGVYIVRVHRADTGGENDTVFVVRQDDRDSAILYQQSVTTMHAYNNFGGKSAYTYNSGVCMTLAGAERAVKVSFNRPYGQPNVDPNAFYHTEYPMIRWLEQQGYDVTYSTNMDTHRSGISGGKNELLDHQVFLVAGHDAYWSQEMRDAITAARDAGVHLAFFTADAGFWRVRFEADPLTQERDSIMVVFKTTESGPIDPEGPTGSWRDPAGANEPENGLLGVMFTGSNNNLAFPLRVSAEQAQDGIYRHTGLASLPPGTYVELGDQIVGWAWDSTVDNGAAPEGLVTLADTPVYGSLLTDAGNFLNDTLAPSRAQMTRYTASSGAIVFAAGALQWSWGLGAQGLAETEADPYISQITYNVLADMGVQPASPVGSLILDGTDGTLPPLEAVQAVEATAPVVISNIQSTIDGENATVTWTTDVETRGQVWYGTQAGRAIFPGGVSESVGTTHSLTLNILNANTAYYFRVAAVDARGNVTFSDENTLTTGTPSSIGDQLSNTFEPILRRGNCWVRANTSLVVAMGVGLVVVLILVAWRFLGRNGGGGMPIPEPEV